MKEQEPQKITLKADNFKFKVRGGRRVKIYIKLNKEESAKWVSLKETFTGGNSQVPDEEVAKVLFFRGINAFMEDIKTQVDAMDEKQREDLLNELQEQDEESSSDADTEKTK